MDRSILQTMFLIVFIATFLNSVLANECHSCNSFMNPGCKDPFHSSQYVTNCEQLLTQHPRNPSSSLFDVLQGLSESNLKSKSVCFKAVFEDHSGSSAHGSASSRGLHTRFGFTDPNEPRPATSTSGPLHVHPPPHTPDNTAECEGGSWKFPKQCSTAKEDCIYEVTWNVIDYNDVHFIIHTNGTNLWTGIGFSKDGKMPQSDAVIGWIHQGLPFILDVWNTGYNQPETDSQQDIKNFTAKLENGKTTLSFVRPIDSGDSKDTPLSGEHCPFFVFPVIGGAYNPLNKKIKKHERVLVSEEPICVKPCQSRRRVRRQTDSPVDMSGGGVVRGCSFRGGKDHCRYVEEFAQQQGLKLKKCNVCEDNKCNLSPAGTSTSMLLLVTLYIMSRLM